MKLNKKLLTRINKTRKSFLTFLLTANLVLVSTGAAELNLATPSANPQESSNSAQVNDNENKLSKELKLDPTGSFVEDELVVKFKDASPESEKTKILSENEAVQEAENAQLKSKLIKVNPKNRDHILEKLKNNSNVEYAHLNHTNKISAGGGGSGLGGTVTTPNDPKYNNEWHLIRINAPIVWNSYKGTSGLRVAVLDTGVNYNLAEFGTFGSGGRIIKGHDFHNNDSDPMDDNGHGTLVAGVLGAKTNNGLDVAAVDWNTPVLAVKTQGNNGSGTNFNLAQGITYATNYSVLVKVISISINGPGNDTDLQNAVNYALSKGVLVVAGPANSASGNPNCFAGYPAAYPGVLAVVGTNEQDTHATGCTQGASGYLMSAPGQNIWTEYALGGPIQAGGTSMATPLVAGSAMVLYSRCYSIPMQNMRAGLMLGQDLGPSGFDQTYGYGRLDLFKAYQMVGGC